MNKEKFSMNGWWWNHQKKKKQALTKNYFDSFGNWNFILIKIYIKNRYEMKLIYIYMYIGIYVCMNAEINFKKEREDFWEEINL